jgi:hypothetical protein
MARHAGGSPGVRAVAAASVAVQCETRSTEKKKVQSQECLAGRTTRTQTLRCYTAQAAPINAFLSEAVVGDLSFVPDSMRLGTAGRVLPVAGA